METVSQDVKFALRVFRKSPIFTAVVVLTLALGIGANTAIFSIVNAVLLRPLPFRDSNQLEKITFSNPGVGLRDAPFSVPEFEDLKSRAGVFEEVSVVWPVSANLTGAKEPQRLELLVVSPNYFSMLGATPQLGRLFGSEDFARGFALAAIISDGLWRRSYGADPNILGRTLRLDNDVYTIVGVLPSSFRHPGKTVAKDVEVWGTAGFGADPFPAPARDRRFLPRGASTPGYHGGRAARRIPCELSSPRQMVHLDGAFATISRGRCPPHDAGADGNRDPDYSHRLREHCQPAPRSRFRKAAGNCSAPHPRSRPLPHGPPITHRVPDALFVWRVRRRRHRRSCPWFHPSIPAIRNPPAKRSASRLEGLAFCSVHFHPHRPLFWPGPGASIHQARCLCCCSRRCAWFRLQLESQPVAQSLDRLGTGAGGGADDCCRIVGAVFRWAAPGLSGF